MSEYLIADPVNRESETRDVQLPAFTRRKPTVFYLILTGPSGVGKYCLLLNEDFSVHGRAFIQVCLHDEPFDENVLGDTDVGIMYVSENNDLQMITMRWPLMHVRLEGGRMLSEIILFCFENALSDGSDNGLDGVKKNPYHFNVRRKLLRSDNCATTKIHQKTSPEEVRKVSSVRCCAEKCC
jgi:hypothetical protein